jgi:hypothetical protein
MSISALLRTLYALCLLCATFTHASILWAHGLFWSYGGAPWSTCVYWTSLTVFDPLAAVLLFVRPRAGVILTAVIIGSDVLHNSWIVWSEPAPRTLGWMYPSQVAFLAFVSLTIRWAWPGSPEARSPWGRRYPRP